MRETSAPRSYRTTISTAEAVARATVHQKAAGLGIARHRLRRVARVASPDVERRVPMRSPARTSNGHTR
jgi:hypothetical protein